MKVYLKTMIPSTKMTATVKMLQINPTLLPTWRWVMTLKMGMIVISTNLLKEILVYWFLRLRRYVYLLFNRVPQNNLTNCVQTDEKSQQSCYPKCTSHQSFQVIGYSAGSQRKRTHWSPWKAMEHLIWWPILMLWSKGCQLVFILVWNTQILITHCFLSGNQLYDQRGSRRILQGVGFYGNPRT